MNHEQMSIEHVIGKALRSFFGKNLFIPLTLIDRLSSLIYMTLVNSGYEITRPSADNQEEQKHG